MRFFIRTGSAKGPIIESSFLLDSCAGVMPIAGDYVSVQGYDRQIRSRHIDVNYGRPAGFEVEPTLTLVVEAHDGDLEFGGELLSLQKLGESGS